MLGIGQKFPAYALTGVVSNDLDHGFKPFNQNSDPGKWQVFFFWPKDFTFVSTAGGAFLEWMEGRTLPGVAALEQSAEQ